MFDRDHRGGSDWPESRKPLPEYDPSTPREKQGMFQKFEVKRTDGKDHHGCKHDGCEYFILDMDCDPFAVDALRAYANACKDTYPELAKDLKAKALRLKRKLE